MVTDERLQESLTRLAAFAGSLPDNNFVLASRTIDDARSEAAALATEVRRLRAWRDTVRAFLAEEARCAALDGSETLRDCFLDAVERLPKP